MNFTQPLQYDLKVDSWGFKIAEFSQWMTINYAKSMHFERPTEKFQYQNPLETAISLRLGVWGVYKSLRGSVPPFFKRQS